MLTERQRTLADMLLDVNAIQFGAFKLKLHDKHPEAPLSPIYINLRTLRSNVKAMHIASDAYAELASGLIFDCYADVPTAATPLVAVLASITGRPMISPSLEQKSHGTGARIDGVYSKGNTALLIDDLITRAESKLEAIRVLESAGLTVRNVIVLVDREQGGIQELRNRGYDCRAALPLSELLENYKSTGRITNDDYLRTKHYLEVNT
jgi:orotate phosphoribosyltransferase